MDNRLLPVGNFMAVTCQEECSQKNTDNRSFTYKNVKYNISTTEKLKIGNHAVLSQEGQPSVIGTISWIGWLSQTNEREIETVAVVNFNHLREHLPGYIQGPLPKRNIVNIKHLMSLEQWHKTFDETAKITGAYSNVNIAESHAPPQCNMEVVQNNISPRHISTDGEAMEPLQTNTSGILHYWDDMFIETTLDDFKKGDDVVWRQEGGERISPRMGKIIWIGWKWEATTAEHRKIFAVVKFDEPTNHLPYTLHPEQDNHNIVNVNELALLSSWLRVQEEDTVKHPFADTEEANHGVKLPRCQSFESNRPTLSGTISTEDKKSETNKCPSPAHHDEVATAASINTVHHQNRKDAPPFLIGGKRSSTARYTEEPKKLKEETKVEAVYLAVAYPENSDRKFGIQGLNNSCYMDASIYSLFAFNKSLDKYVCPEEILDKRKESEMPTARTRLQSIIKELRRHHFVSNRRMKKLRNEFVLQKGSQYEDSYMDAEEFIINLFQLLDVSGLFIYDHGGEDYVHQILLPKERGKREKRNYLSLQALLEDSFKASDVKLKAIPKSAFIIKLPVSDGKLISCDGVVPNTSLDLSPIIDGVKSASMRLQAIICLTSCHFVSFVCLDPIDDASRWVFMDSQPAIQEPSVHFLEGLSRNIQKAQEELETELISKYEPECGGYRLFRDAYICVYVPASQVLND